jgi:hypothetical protein
VYLVHLVLRNPCVPCPGPADAERIQKFLWAGLDEESAVEHIRSRPYCQGIDVGIFLRGEVGSGEAMELMFHAYIKPLIAQLPGWVIVPPEASGHDQ